MALGADPVGVARAFLARGGMLVGAGLAIGLGVSLVLTRALDSLLFGVARLDPVTYAVVARLTFLVAMAATSIPALATARVDPTVALRTD
jgi:ABC-type antimicrobial peptide transport system permease subunit